MTPTTSPTTPAQVPVPPTMRVIAHHQSPQRDERLNGEIITDRTGNASQPSEAHAVGPGSAATSLLMQRELNYLSWLASTLIGTGRVVELGCFLGGSSAALAHGAASNPRFRFPIISHDSFEIPNDYPSGFSSWFTIFGLGAGERFRDRFESNLGDALTMFEVREGWIPECRTREQETAIYPEQEPIELLFVDIAKAWGVHQSVMRTFARHLEPGGVLVQQDFFDLFTPWIALHMWQLRDLFEPLDVIHGSATVSFRCLGPCADRLGTLWTLAECESRETRRRIWEQVRSYWGGVLGPQYARILHGHEALHAYRCGDIEEFVRCGRRYDAWYRSAESRDLYRCQSWPDLIATLYQSATEAERSGLRQLAAESAARGQRYTLSGPNTPGQYCTPERRRVVWDNALGRCRRAGMHHIALFGAGNHTRWLSEDYTLDPEIEIVCVIDEAKTTNPFPGVPTCSPSQARALLDATTAILPSSDVHEAQMLRRLDELFGDNGAAIVPVYTYSDNPESVRGFAYQYTFDAESAPLASDPTIVISDHRPARAQLGLSPHRPWVPVLLDTLGTPRWVTGCVEPEEIAFIWDFIELVRPMNMVELGTASGYSTAQLLAGIAHLCPPGACVHSFDIAADCYFDPIHHVGSAIAQIAPGLLDRARLHAIADADDAAAFFPTASIDLAFIDANHAHPAPTLDLLALVNTVKPGAWVILHDIELGRRQEMLGSSQWALCSGAQRLYDLWPFEKHRLTDPDPRRCNIGAIRIPADFAKDPAPVLAHLLATLEGPYEIEGALAERAAKATKILENRE